MTQRLKRVAALVQQPADANLLLSSMTAAPRIEHAAALDSRLSPRTETRFLHVDRSCGAGETSPNLCCPNPTSQFELVKKPA